MKKRHRIIQNSTNCECCHLPLTEQECPNDKCILYSYKFKQVESIDIPEIDEVLSTVSQESKERIAQQIKDAEDSSQH